MGVVGEMELQICVQRVVDRIKSNDSTSGEAAQNKMIAWFKSKDEEEKKKEEEEKKKEEDGTGGSTS